MAPDNGAARGRAVELAADRGQGVWCAQLRVSFQSFVSGPVLPFLWHLLPPSCPCLHPSIAAASCCCFLRPHPCIFPSSHLRCGGFYRLPFLPPPPSLLLPCRPSFCPLSVASTAPLPPRIHCTPLPSPHHRALSRTLFSVPISPLPSAPARHSRGARLVVGLLFCFGQWSAVAGREVDMVALEERVGRLREGGGMGGVVWSVVGTVYGHLGRMSSFLGEAGDVFALSRGEEGSRV
ncbi:hypothetical protein B0H14DRAFT_1059151 [Mycena olivaceomarginata]|nr:hypothetical protein B0H14DRAFT_1059151 [Mycena olivaceomarginata]